MTATAESTLDLHETANHTHTHTHILSPWTSNRDDCPHIDSIIKEALFRFCSCSKPAKPSKGKKTLNYISAD